MARTRSILLLAVALSACPPAARALELHWYSGTAALTFTQATRCTLVVGAGPSSATLPPEWQLLWTADSCAIIPVAVPADCGIGLARVSRVGSPAGASEVAAHQIEAEFCSQGAAPAGAAWYVLDLPAGSRGAFKVVALDPADPDSNTVLQSGIVTFNGGVERELPPVVLRTRAVHQSTDYEVTLIGAGLSAPQSLKLVAPNAAWDLPLAIESPTDTRLVGRAALAAVVPECVVQLSSAAGEFAPATLPAEPEPVFDPQSCQATFIEDLLSPPPPPLAFAIQPKDFAFTQGFVDPAYGRYALHLFYIRHNYWYYQGAVHHPELDEKNLGHIWTFDFNSWFGPNGLNQPDTLALAVRPGMFDEFHVWAPSIIQHGPTFYMFYTGVKKLGQTGPEHQRIGVATSTDLNTWTALDQPVLTAPQVEWAEKVPPSQDFNESQQLRDPFVMADPIVPNRWLMYFVALDSCGPTCTPTMAVGVATSTNLLDWSPLPKPFSSTHRPTFLGTTTNVESPHVFRRNGQWWMPYTVNGTEVVFQTSASADPTDTVATHWTDPIRLKTAAEGDPPILQFWHATEYLRASIGDSRFKEYLAAFDDAGISIDIRGMFAPSNPLVDSVLLDCPEVLAAGGSEQAPESVRISVSRPHVGSRDIEFRLVLPSRSAVRLTVHDIAGRRLKTLLDAAVAGGATTVHWDGRDDSGARVPSGTYFVRLATPLGNGRSKLVMLR